MDVRLLTDEPTEELRRAWDDLFATDPDATPFVSPGWADAWLRHWAAGLRFRAWIVGVYDSGQLVGLAALALRRRGPIRVLHPLGAYVANYWDVLARPEHRLAVEASVAREIARQSHAWDAIALDTLPPSSGLRDQLVAAGLRLEPRGSRPYPGIVLPTTFEEYLSGLTRQHRSNLRRHLRALERAELEVIAVREPRALDRP